MVAHLLATGDERQILEGITMTSYALFDSGIYHVVRLVGISSFGFEIRFEDFASGKDEALFRADLFGIPFRLTARRSCMVPWPAMAQTS